MSPTYGGARLCTLGSAGNHGRTSQASARNILQPDPGHLGISWRPHPSVGAFLLPRLAIFPFREILNGPQESAKWMSSPHRNWKNGSYDGTRHHLVVTEYEIHQGSFRTATARNECHRGWGRGVHYPSMRGRDHGGRFFLTTSSPSPVCC